MVSSSDSLYSSPTEALCALLDNFWADSTGEDPLKQWKSYVRQSSLPAKRLLQDLDILIENPPDNLPEILQDNGWIYLYHCPEDESTIYSFEEHLEWLKGTVARLWEIYNTQTNSPEATLQKVLQQFWLERTEELAALEWTAYVENHPEEAQKILSDLDEILEHPPSDLATVIEKWGWIHLSSTEEYLEWLRKNKARFQEIYWSQYKSDSEA